LQAGADLLEQAPGLLAASDGKKLVHLRHDAYGGLVFWIEFNRIKKFASECAQ
jgi:hypothetical protein